MRRLCERPGCSGPASVSYGMDATARIVWLDPSPAIDPARAGSLCRRHADALTAPRGWTLDDRREVVPRLLRVPENPAPSTIAPTRETRTKKEPRTTPPSLFDSKDAEPQVEEPSEVVVDDERPDETKAIPWVPKLGQSSGADDAPRGGLLGRAFGDRNR